VFHEKFIQAEIDPTNVLDQRQDTDDASQQSYTKGPPWSA
jgi:hypothetical protein